MLRIRLAANDDPVHLFVDALDDGGQGRVFLFNDGRIVPVYCYYPGDRRGYVIRCGGPRSGTIPNIEGNYRLLLTVRGSEVERLEKAVRRLYAHIGFLEAIPEAFWPQLGALVAFRAFRVNMAVELYFVVKEKQLLQEELSLELEGQGQRASGSKAEGQRTGTR